MQIKIYKRYPDGRKTFDLINLEDTTDRNKKEVEIYNPLIAEVRKTKCTVLVVRISDLWAMTKAFYLCADNWNLYCRYIQAEDTQWNKKLICKFIISLDSLCAELNNVASVILRGGIMFFNKKWRADWADNFLKDYYNQIIFL